VEGQLRLELDRTEISMIDGFTLKERKNSAELGSRLKYHFLVFLCISCES